MKKRRTFDIDLPEAAGEDEVFPAGKISEPQPVLQRRSPMAAAITENAESLKDRRALEAEIRAENDALAAEHVRMKKLGLIVDLLPLDQIEAAKLARDRAAGEDPELAELKLSIRELGLSNPIRVEAREDGRYELIQGWRRLSAYRELLAETGDAERYGQIPAGILPRGEDLESLYRRMVDENMVRKDISFAEMAQLALNYAADPGTGEASAERAVALLFQSAGYSKRSYIRRFILLLERLGDALEFAPHLPRALGLRLADLLERDAGIEPRIRAALAGAEGRDAEGELAILRGFAELAAEPAAKAAAPVAAGGKAKTTFQIASPLGTAKCTAANGRLEIRLGQDFSALDRKRLEAALARMLADLG